jgi:aspartate aminotransferase-like enzyme
MYSHRSAEYKRLHRETVEALQIFLETEAQVYLFSSTGTGFMEAAVRNCVNKKILCCVNGSFGKRFTEVAQLNGKIVKTIEPSLGDPINPDELDEKLVQCPDVEAVSITHNETSTGLLNPLSKLAAVVKKHGKLLFVDAVSAMGGTEIKVDKWGIDVCFSSSQKCFGVPPGLGIGSVSKEALQKAETVQNPGWYFNFKIWEKYHKRDGTPMTSTIPQIAGLNQILKTIDELGGKESFFEVYRTRNITIRDKIQKLGLSTFPKKGYESPTLSCINAPKNIDGIAIYEKMREKGFELAKGYGVLKNTTFRIGNMGYMELQDIAAMVDALKEVRQEYGW